MKKRELKIVFSWERRVNDHDIPNYALYVNGKKVYSARYESCVVNYINENYAKGTLARLKKKFNQLAEKDQKLRQQIREIERVMEKPLVPFSRESSL